MKKLIYLFLALGLFTAIACENKVETTEDGTDGTNTEVIKEETNTTVVDTATTVVDTTMNH